MSRADNPFEPSAADERRREVLAHALLTQGSVAGAARALGISPSTAWRWIAEFDLTPPRPRRLWEAP